MEAFTVSSPAELDRCVEENGVAILPGVLTTEECRSLKDEISPPHSERAPLAQGYLPNRLDSSCVLK